MSNITERLTEAAKMYPIIEDQPYSLFVDSLAEIKELQAQVAKLEADEPDLVWDYKNQQDPGYEPEKIVSKLADTMQSGESRLFAVACAKKMPNREMNISVSEESEVRWQWAIESKKKSE